MTGCSRGDVVLVNFVFTEGTGGKLRPAVIVSCDIYHRSRREVVICAITSNVDRLLVGDHLITGWKHAGLLMPSTCTGIVRTIRGTMVDRKIGTMPKGDMHAIDVALRTSLGL